LMTELLMSIQMPSQVGKKVDESLVARPRHMGNAQRLTACLER